MERHLRLNAAIVRGEQVLVRAHALSDRARAARELSVRLVEDSRRLIPPMVCAACGGHLFDLPPASGAPAYCARCHPGRGD